MLSKKKEKESKSRLLYQKHRLGARENNQSCNYTGALRDDLEEGLFKSVPAADCFDSSGLHNSFIDEAELNRE